MEQVFFNVPLKRLEPVFKRWVQEAQQDLQKVTDQKQPDPDQLMTRQQAADFLSVNLATLWRYTKSGTLPAHQIGSRVYYKRSEILECLERINPNKKGGEK